MVTLLLSNPVFPSHTHTNTPPPNNPMLAFRSIPKPQNPLRLRHPPDRSGSPRYRRAIHFGVQSPPAACRQWGRAQCGRGVPEWGAERRVGGGRIRTLPSHQGMWGLGRGVCVCGGGGGTWYCLVYFICIAPRPSATTAPPVSDRPLLPPAAHIAGRS